MTAEGKAELLADFTNDTARPLLDKLGEPALTVFAERYLAARSGRDEQVDRATDAALRHLPALLRRPVRKILGV